MFSISTQMSNRTIYLLISRSQLNTTMSDTRQWQQKHTATRWMRTYFCIFYFYLSIVSKIEYVTESIMHKTFKSNDMGTCDFPLLCYPLSIANEYLFIFVSNFVFAANINDLVRLSGFTVLTLSTEHTVVL